MHLLEISSLDSLSPLKVLNRGYGLVKHDNKIIKSIDDVNIDEKIDLELKDGKIKALVTYKEKNTHGK